MTEHIQSDQRIISTEVVRLASGDTIEVPNSGVPTQVANPGRAVIRTLAANLVGLVLLLPTINAALAALQDFLTTQTIYVIPSWVWVVVNGAAAAFLFVSLGITRLLAVPGVNAWVIKHIPALAAIPVVKTDDGKG